MGSFIGVAVMLLFTVGFLALLPGNMSFLVADNSIREDFVYDEYIEFGVPPQKARALLIEEADRMLNRACQTAKAWIIRCQECFLSGNTNCPYPTQSFCNSASGANINDFNLMWGFLPNSTGNLSEIWSAPSMNPNNMTNVNQIPLGIRWIIQNQYPQSVFGVFDYERPSAVAGADPCSVTEVVVNP